jgi:hypothetical protein
MNLDIGTILNRAYETVIKNRVLWGLGLIAALLAGTIQTNWRTDANDTVRWALSPGWAAMIITGVLVLVVALFLLRSLIDAALISAGDRSSIGSAPTFREAWTAGWRHIWPVVALNLIFAALMFVFAIGVAIFVGLAVAGGVLTGLFTGQFGPDLPDISRVLAGLGVGLTLLLLLALIAVPLAVAVALTTQLAQRAAVLEGQSVGVAWQTGWRLVRTQTGPLVITLLAQWVVNFLVGLVTMLVMVPFLVVPLAVLFTSGGFTADLPTIAAAILLLGLAWVLSAVVRAVPTAWNSVLWTLFYRAATVGLPIMSRPTPLFRGPMPPVVPHN